LWGWGNLIRVSTPISDFSELVASDAIPFNNRTRNVDMDLLYMTRENVAFDVFASLVNHLSDTDTRFFLEAWRAGEPMWAISGMVYAAAQQLHDTGQCVDPWLVRLVEWLWGAYYIETRPTNLSMPDIPAQARPGPPLPADEHRFTPWPDLISTLLPSSRSRVVAWRVPLPVTRQLSVVDTRRDSPARHDQLRHHHHHSVVPGHHETASRA
jgi:hypothetical protein